MMNKICVILSAVILILSAAISTNLYAGDTTFIYKGQTFDTPQAYLQKQEEDIQKAKEEEGRQKEKFYKAIEDLTISQEKTEKILANIAATLSSIDQKLSPAKK
jgi:hypothetical protein